jgi:hypothetical protein
MMFSDALASLLPSQPVAMTAWARRRNRARSRRRPVLPRGMSDYSTSSRRAWPKYDVVDADVGVACVRSYLRRGKHAKSENLVSHCLEEYSARRDVVNAGIWTSFVVLLLLMVVLDSGTALAAGVTAVISILVLSVHALMAIGLGEAATALVVGSTWARVSICRPPCSKTTRFIGTP